jgi:hypothetical protein
MEEDAMDDTTLLLLAIFWLIMLTAAFLIAQSRGRSTQDALILTLFLGPLGLLIAAFGNTPFAKPQSAGQRPDPTPPHGPPPGSVADELAKLASLRDQGVLSSDEFEVAKRRLIAQ